VGAASAKKKKKKKTLFFLGSVCRRFWFPLSDHADVTVFADATVLHDISGAGKDGDKTWQRRGKESGIEKGSNQ
jgi:hypothetical protein